MAYLPINQTQFATLLSPYKTAYPAIPLGTYLLLYTTANDFLAGFDGSTTTYPHRALAFSALTLANAMVKLFVSQSSPTSLDLVHIALNDESDFIPTSIAGTPFAFRVTRNVTFTAAQAGTVPTVYVATAPDTDDYAYPVSLGVGILEAMQDINNMLVAAPVILYYESSVGVYAPFVTVEKVAIP